MATVISVEHLAKRYRIGTKVRHNAIRDVFDEKLASLLKGGAAKAGSEDNFFWALNDISFKVEEGEVLGIIGRNGAGKSTLLKLLSRITEPTSGLIRIKGRVASLLEVGTGFSGELTGRENIFLNGAILGMRNAEIGKKFDEIVSFAEIERFLDTPVKHYSSGMYMRLAFSIAAQLEPDILVVDEVLAVGDAQFQKKCLGKMRDVSQEGRTVLFVSHNMAAVNSFCKTGIVLHSGSLHFQGSAKDTVTSYAQLQESNTGERTMAEHEQVIRGEGVHILSARIISEGSVTANVSINSDFLVEMEFFNDKDGRYLSSNIQLFALGGVGVLSTANWASATLHSDSWSGRKYPKGVFRASCKIPAFFLNEGSFYVNLLILSDVSSTIARVENAISFSVVDSGDMRKEYTDGWLGVVRPKLEWETKFLGEQVSDS